MVAKNKKESYKFTCQKEWCLPLFFITQKFLNVHQYKLEKMEEIAMSSCSFVEDMDNEHPEEEANETDVQNLQLENERLNEVNIQLQQSIENLKKQLKEAADTVYSVQAISSQLQSTKQQLKESTDKNNELTEQVKDLLSRIENYESNSKQQAAEFDSEKEQLNNEIKSLSDQKSKLRTERNALKKEAEDKTLAIESLYTKLENAKNYKRKTRAKTQEMVQSIIALQNEIDQKNLLLQQAETDKNNMNQDSESLKLKADGQARFIDDLKEQISKMQVDMSTKENAFAQLEDQMNSQTDEIEKITKEKQNFIALLQKQSTAMTVLELKLESLLKENQTLKNKLLQKSGKSQAKTVEVLDLKIPFEGEIGSNCEKTLKMVQFQPMQRVQMILNDLSTYLLEVEQELRSSKKLNEKLQSETNDANVKAETWRQIVDSVLCDLGSLKLSESHLNKLSGSINDKDFIDYLAAKTSELDPMIRETIFNDQHFISSDFFFTDDITRKKTEIQTISDVSDTAFAILTAQFISNNILRQQISSFLALNELSTAPEQVEKSDHFESEQNHLETQEKLEKMTKLANNYKAQLKKAQQGLQKTESDQRTQLTQLQVQVDNLNSELEVTKMKLEVSQNELISKQEEFSNFVQNAPTPEMVSKLEEELKNKTDEVNQLSALIKQAQIDNAAALLSKNKQIKKQEEIFRREIADLNDKLAAIIHDADERRSKQRRKDKAAELQHQATISELQKGFEQTKNFLNQTIDQLKEKVQKANEEIQNVNSKLEQCEALNKQIKQDNENLNNAQKKLQSELNANKTQINKERQQISGQLAAQAMIYEAKIQKAVKDAANNAEKKIEEFLKIASNAFASLYEIDEEDFCEESFKQLISLVKSDLEKLRYFQSEATKFTNAK